MRKYLVYFIQSVNGGPIKIGKSLEGSLFTRFISIQIGNPEELKIIGITYDFLEKDLHKQFQEFRLRGEWFSDSIELLDFINSNCIDYNIGIVTQKNRNINIDENYHVTKDYWTQEEIDLVAKYYPSDEPLDLLLSLLPGRTLKSVRHIASSLRLRRKQRSSLFKGVYWHKKQQKWNVIINKQNQRLNLGTFESEEEARDAYENYVKNHQIK